ncbi:G-type lectin S-receptor-like serine/threonine-protein kinase At4g27290 [Lycium barbarum]|uniref:G-type lectin S-receptor-like serine/threonine-protein kinase At4g27290 n=1 Tax=Lycium barbarum TaxID=112863 RepID=UPI00293E4C8A|nr:G-type lectin S-receptor-like serine/threonine-protein kinase At4g27290 [Lycium barbarum]
MQNPIAQLLDSGNLVVKEAGDGNPIKFLWQSFDHPTDTLLPGMKLGRNYNILKKGSDVVYRSGPWNGLHFSGAQNSRKDSFYTFGIFLSKTEVYFGYYLTSSVITRLILNHKGVLQGWYWGEHVHDWIPYLSVPRDNCDAYKLCGAYGICNSQTLPVCGCLDKFVPKHYEDWQKADWSGGCVRRTQLTASKEMYF